MKLIVISDTKWVESHPRRQRPGIIRMIFSLAAQNGYTVVVKGQHWPR